MEHQVRIELTNNGAEKNTVAASLQRGKTPPAAQQVSWI